MSLLTRFHVAPASSERNTPPSCACTIAYTTFGLLCATEMPIFPSKSLAKPGCDEIFVQCAPPSTVLYNALPGPPLVSPHGIRCACHIDAYSTSGWRSSMTTCAEPVSALT